MKQRILYILLSIAIIALDLWTKALVLARIDLHETIPVIPNFFQLVHVRNTGAAFGIGANASSQLVPLLLNFGAIAVFCVVVVYALRSAVTDRVLQTGLHLILGGAIGNLLDRFRFGFVVDFLDVYVGNKHWPAFNVADSAICIGIALLFFDMRKKPEEAPAGVVAG
ncbi:MAG TPA: signal peptidase II [Thermoanaerobaculia bacterium]|jgi:signal peptidase II|nr:signal peptidase II [Thermoanaerobaculia bacterium]